MNTLHLNLMSADKKRGFHKLVQFIFIKQLLEFIIITAALLAITHLMALAIISQSLTDLASSTLLVNKEQTATNREVRRLNKLTNDITVSGEEFVEISPKLVELIGLVPPSITIQALEINRAGNSFYMAGIANTRPALLEFQKIMQSVVWLTNVSAPTSQLFQKENVSFEIRGTLTGFSTLPKKAAAPRPAVIVED